MTIHSDDYKVIEDFFAEIDAADHKAMRDGYSLGFALIARKIKAQEALSRIRTDLVQPSSEGVKAKDAFNWLKSLHLIRFDDTGFNDGLSIDTFNNQVRTIQEYLNKAALSNSTPEQPSSGEWLDIEDLDCPDDHYYPLLVRSSRGKLIPVTGYYSDGWFDVSNARAINPEYYMMYLPQPPQSESEGL